MEKIPDFVAILPFWDIWGSRKGPLGPPHPRFIVKGNLLHIIFQIKPIPGVLHTSTRSYKGKKLKCVKLRDLKTEKKMGVIPLTDIEPVLPGIP